jgi:hypothetical protein
MQIIEQALAAVKTDQSKAINLLYDILERGNLLNYFTIDTMKLRQIRVKNYDFDVFDDSKSEQMVAISRESSPLRMNGDFVEYDQQELKTKLDLDFDRAAALDFYDPETATPEKTEELAQLLKKMQVKLAFLFGKNMNPETSASKTGFTAPSESKTITIKFDEVLDMSDFTPDPILHRSTMETAILQEFDFNFVGLLTSVEELTCKEGEKPLEVLDIADLRIIQKEKLYDQATSQKKAKKLLEHLVQEEKETLELIIEHEYLEGYNDDVMKNPIWLSSDNLTEADAGKELLFRKKRIKSSSEKIVYNEYFVKKV